MGKLIKLKWVLVTALAVAAVTTGATAILTVSGMKYFERLNDIFADVRFESRTVYYNGLEHSVAVSGLPDGVPAVYANNTATEVGECRAFAYMQKDGKEKVMSAVLTIKRATVTGVSFENATRLYNGEVHGIEITGELPNGVDVEYFVNDNPFAGAKDIGTYNVTAKISGGFYEDLILTATLTITTGEFNDVTFAGKTVEYNGGAQTITVGNLPAGAAVAYEYAGEKAVGNTAVVPGVYTVTATIECENYRTAVRTATLTITKAAITGVYFQNKTVVYDGTVHQMEITGNVPAGVIPKFTYLFGGEFNGAVGSATGNSSYTVIAKLIGGEYYEDYVFSDYGHLYIIKPDARLSPITGLAMEEDTGGTAVNLKWNTEPNTRYRLYVYNSAADEQPLATLEKYKDNNNNDQFITGPYNIRGWLLALGLPADVYHFRIAAIPTGNKESQFAESEISAVSVSYNHNRAVFPPPQNLKYENDTLSWDAVPGADCYLLKIYLVGADGNVIRNSRDFQTENAARAVPLTEIKDAWFVGAGNYRFAVSATVYTSAGMQTAPDSSRKSAYVSTGIIALE